VTDPVPAGGATTEQVSSEPTATTERPSATTERPAHTSGPYGADVALVVVDVQNDFADPAGSLYITGGEQVISICNSEIDAALAAGSPVFYTQDWHPDETPHFAKFGGIWPEHCVHDTWGAAFHPELRVVGPVVQKGTGGEDGYSGFSMRHPVSGELTPTSLAGLLAGADVRSIVIAGLAGDYCVKETSLDARRLGYGVFVPLATTRFVNLETGDDERAVDAMKAAGVEVSGELPDPQKSSANGGA
jgi:nicotinamidase/pyrazinamidase